MYVPSLTRVESNPVQTDHGCVDRWAVGDGDSGVRVDVTELARWQLRGVQGWSRHCDGRRSAELAGENWPPTSRRKRSSPRSRMGVTRRARLLFLAGNKRPEARIPMLFTCILLVLTSCSPSAPIQQLRRDPFRREPVLQVRSGRVRGSSRLGSNCHRSPSHR